MKLEDYSSKLNKAITKQELLQKQLDDTKQALIKAQSNLETVEKAQVFLQTVAKNTQDKLRYHIEDIVQLALDTCFPGQYDFDVEFEIKRGRTETVLSFVKDGEKVNPLDAAGGGAADLAAFALRIAAWTLGHSDNTIILDEPFRFLSKDLQPKAGEIMKRLSEKLGLQFIMVTHNPDIIEVSDRVFKVARNKRRSVVTVEE